MQAHTRQLSVNGKSAMTIEQRHTVNMPRAAILFDNCNSMPPQPGDFFGDKKLLIYGL
jgi:hypothetical protein